MGALSDTQIAAMRRRIRVFALAAVDMQQVIEAARAIEREGENYQLVRALEAAVAVCYWRPFTKSRTIGHLEGKKYAPPDQSGLHALHFELERVRNRVYAHTEEEGGRDAGIEDYLFEGKPLGVIFTEQWMPLDRANLPSIVALAEMQQGRFRAEAFQIKEKLPRIGREG